MRPLVIIAVLISGATLAAAESTDLALGPASVHVGTSDVPSCVASPPGLPCIVGYDDAGTLGSTDDTVYQYRAVEEVVIASEAGLPADGASVDLRDTRADHRLIDTGESIFLLVHGGLPGPLRERSYVAQWQNDSVFVVVLSDQDSVTGSTLIVPIHWMAPYTDRTGTRSPNGIELEDTDEWVPRNLGYLRSCDWPQVEENFPLCGRVPWTDQLPLMWASLTPRLVTGAEVNQTTVASRPPSPPLVTQGEPGAHAASPGHGGWSRGLDSTVHPRPLQGSELGALATAAVPMAPLSSAATPPAHHQFLESFAAGPGVLWVVLAFSMLLAPVAALYQRLTRERCVRQANRARLLDLVRERPGLLLAEAAAELGIAYQSARHHVRILRRFGHLDVIKAGHNVVLFPSGSVPHALRQAIPRLQRGPLARTLVLVQQAPGSTASTVAAQAGTKRSSACARLGSLADLGLLQRDPHGACTISPLGLQALDVVRDLRHSAEPER